MPPSLALFLWAILLVVLFRLDPAKEIGASAALWVPLIWILIIGSRLPSQWLGFQTGSLAVAFEEGNGLDRIIYLLLMLLAVSILGSRSFDWSYFFSHNVALVSLVSFALLSVLWSDYSFVAFKRWFRDLGNYLAIFVVLSDAQPSVAVRTLFRRVCYILIPLSIVLVKYYPALARQYSFWTGEVSYSGVATSKNLLGVLCLFSGLFFFWDTLVRWPDRKEKQTRRVIWVNIAFLAMTLWLLNIADSATSSICLGIGAVVIALAHRKTFRDHPRLLAILIPTAICLYMLLEFGLGIDVKAALAQAVGRDPTLTGRTEIWELLLGADTNPFLGTGYESFWLGERLQWVWRHSGRINEAHNGYLEVYLSLGLIGLFLLIAFLIASYRTIRKEFIRSPGLGSFSLALWTTLVVYNVTESAFKGHLIWVAFMMVVIAVQRRKDSVAEESNHAFLYPVNPRRTTRTA